MVDWEKFKKDAANFVGLTGLVTKFASALEETPPTVRQVRQKNDTYTENMLTYPKVIIAGPTRVGKSTTLDMLEELNGNRFERGTKYKHRFIGGPWPDNNQKKDSKVVNTLEKVESLRKQGKVAFEYSTVDTLHLVGSEDAIRADKHIVYISDSHNGAMAFRQYFVDPITFLFYTSPEIIATRLRNSNIPDEQIRARLQTFENEFALFRQHSPEYLFLMFVGTPPIDRTSVLDETARGRKIEEIRAEAQRVILLIEQYGIFFKPRISYVDFHRAYVNHQAQKLVGSDLTNLEGKLVDGTVKLDLSEQVRQHAQSKYVPREVLAKLDNIEVVKSFYANGRHTILLRGLVDPLTEPQYIPEDIVLELIALKLGEPTQRRSIKGQDYSKHSNFGLFNIVNGGLLKDGAAYSLGDQLVDDTHVSLNIGFLYHKVRQPPQVTGYTMADIQRLGLAVGGKQIRPF